MEVGQILSLPVSTVPEQQYTCYLKVSFAGSPLVGQANLSKRHP